MAKTQSVSDTVSEFTRLVTRSCLSLADKEYFLARFYEDGGLEKEVEMELIEKLEEAGVMTRIAIEMEKEGAMKELEEQLKKMGAKSRVRELVDATTAYQKALEARDKAMEKHDTAFTEMEEKILKKYNGNDEDPAFLAELKNTMELYKNKHEKSFQKRIDAVEEARVRVDKAEFELEDLKNHV